MRYYFHLHDGTKLSRDPAGLFTTRNDAWKLALSLIKDARRNHPGIGPTAHVYLADEIGNTYVIPFDLVDEPEKVQSRELVSA